MIGAILVRPVTILRLVEPNSRQRRLGRGEADARGSGRSILGLPLLHAWVVKYTAATFQTSSSVESDN